MKLYKLASIAAVLSLTLLTTIGALEVDEDEIRSIGNEVVTFENYMGPHAYIETVDAIRSIGSGLGSQVASNLNAQAEYGRGAKYSVIHAIDPSEKSKYDADILFINENAQVDHIRNLRRIIQGYLMVAYGYNLNDAATVSTFVTVYNAVYRKNLDVFKQRYKNVVVQNLTADKCGLSTKWDEWPGNSQIVIPLFDLNSNLSAVDTSAISDKKVIDSMREADDRGVDERKNMVDIKEREAEDYANKAQKAAEDAAEKNKALEQQKKKSDAATKEADAANKDADAAKKAAETAQKKSETAQKTAETAQKTADTAKKDAQTAQQNAQKAREEADKNPDDKQKQQAAQTAQKQAETAQKKSETAQKTADTAKQNAQTAKQDAAQKQQDATQKQQTATQKTTIATTETTKTEQQKKVVEEAQKKAGEQQAIADKKQSEAQKERTEIAKDMQRLLAADLDDLDNKNSVIGLKLTDSQTLLSKMIRIDTTSGVILRESPVNVIRGRTIYPVAVEANSKAVSATGEDSILTPVMYLAVCGQNSNTNNSAVKLCLLDSKKMEIQKESKEFVAEDSVLTTDGTNFYCVIKEGNDWVVAKYDSQVNLLLKSSVPVMSNTPITVTPMGLVVMSADGSVILLNLKDLSQITTGPSTLTGIVNENSAKATITPAR